MYGTQAKDVSRTAFWQFENDVNMYGTQAVIVRFSQQQQFENDVNMYGTQATPKYGKSWIRV